VLDVVLVAEHLREAAALQGAADAVGADVPLGVAEAGGEQDAVSAVRRSSTTPSASQRITLTGSVANWSETSESTGSAARASRVSGSTSSWGSSMWSAGTCHASERDQEARIGSRTTPDLTGSFDRNDTRARASSSVAGPAGTRVPPPAKRASPTAASILGASQRKRSEAGADVSY
jgi:hypothetical protein